MTGLSIDGPEVKMTFQSHKRANKSSEYYLYTNKNGTHWGNKGADIASITTKPVKKSAPILACQIMRKQEKGECTLDILSAANAYVQGKRLN